MAQGVYQGENKIADLNVIEGVKVNGTELTPDGSKKVDVLIPDISTDIAEDATSDTKTASPKAVKTYVDNHVPSVPVTDVTVGGSSVLSNGTAAVPAIHNVPSGGSQGQVLAKSSGTDYAVEWVNQSGGTEVEANPTVPSGTTPTSLTGLKVGSDYYSVSGGGGGGTTVEANPTVPSGTTPTDVKGLKIGNDYYDICAVHLDITNNDIDSAINTAWV